MPIRVATFNVENLFARYRFREGRETMAATGFGINDLAFDIYDEALKRVTAEAIQEVKADVICLQEVENLAVLERLNSMYLPSSKYKYRLLIDSHDPRFIDVAVLSKYPFLHINTHRDERTKTTWLFSRDCLEVDVDVDGKILSLYVNHFKSMMEGRDETRDRRLEQTARVAEIVDARWKNLNYKGNFIVLGDFNDYDDPKTGVKPLLTHPGLENVVKRIPGGDDAQWTHYWAGGGEYRQLDYLLLSKALADTNPGPPTIMRKGMPWRAQKYTGPRFPDVGENDPKASDHAPVYMDLDLI
jgi:endonuclease/exonuclease/phosphatase family metal-dependent hydrolase